jgi:epsilon-lactone hydrolase
MSNDDTALQLPAQSIPAPKSISPQGQAYLAAAATRTASLSKPGSVTGQNALSVDALAAAAVQFLRPLANGFKGIGEKAELPSGAKLYRMIPEGRTGKHAKVAYFDIHGGGFTSGGGEMCELLAKIRASDYGVEVFAIDYRLAPEHVFPAALDDCAAAYRAILERYHASALVVGGASAGGNLAAALVLRAQDEGLSLPVALLLQTPAVDMTRSGDSHKTNRLLDVNLYGGDWGGPASYAGGADLKYPYLSPLFGDFAKGWPPTLLTTGTRDLLLSDTVLMHRVLRGASVAAQLRVTEAGPHGGFMGANAPEDAEIMAECRRFLASAWRLTR